ncbi:putative prophage protein [Escherichia coli]|nr:putative prophage protein [Escherichia coli]CTZ85349.1 putative prophage protein [Escherichia coli]CTZ86753.1 putative prophage protein [Escherichia coli]
MMTTKLSLPELDITKLPDRSQALLNEMHEETGISREILLSVMLTVKAASVQDTHEVELSGGQRTSLQIFMCLSSASGSGKTSACAKLIAPVHETEEELHQAYIDDKKNYDRMMEMWTTDKKILERRYKKEMERSPENAAAARAALEKCIANKPVPPTQQVLIVNDATPGDAANLLI